MLKFRYLLLASLIIFSVGGKSQSLRPFIKNYTTKDYGDTINSQSWSVSQDSRGIMYFGNVLKLLEFDGENWNVINTSASGAYITSILPDSSSRIYVGAQKEFGYLYPNDEDGEYIYTGLSDSLEDADKPTDKVWKTLKYKDGILFFTEQKLFFYSNNSIKIIKPKTTFHNIFIVEGELYARQREIGLMKFENNEFKLLPNGELFSLYGVFGMHKNPKSNNILISTQEVGFYNLTSSGIAKIETKDEALLINSHIFGGQLLSDGNIALRTAQNGVIIIDFKANIKNIFNKEVGLLDNDVKQVFQGKEGSLWLAMNSGLAKINYTSQISYYKDKSGLSGRVKSITKFNNTLFVGTSDGLYVEDTLFPIYNRKYYKAINEGVLSISKSKDDLFIGTKNNLLVLNKETSNLTVIDRIDASSTYWSEKKEMLYIVGDNGLAIYKKRSGAFKKIAFDDWAMIQDVTSLVEDEKHDDGKTYLWAGSLNSGVINYIIDKDLNISPPDIYRGENGGLDKGWTNLFKHNNSFVAATVTGLMSLIDAETIKETLNDSTIVARGTFFFSDFYQSSSTYTYLVEQNKLIWSCIDGSVVLQNKEDTNIISKPFKSIDLENIVSLFPEMGNKLWVGADKGIAFVDLSIKKDFNTRPNINIRKVTIGIDSVIFSGLFFDKKNNKVLDNQENNLIPVIDYSLNNISILFASICDEDGKKAEYSYKLEGYDNEWSKWGRASYANYKKIASGSYTFLVKSRSIYGNESEVSEYKFVINPPWYDTVWAYIVYFILFIVLIYVIVKLSIKRLKAKNEELERIVQERTKEISEQRDELSEQKKEIEDSINYAQRIQEAVMPHSEYIEKIMNDYFILFKPKDVVSGDFYWSIKTGNKVIITAADCTGHGVPGAFMSMLGISFLNQIVKMEGVTHAHQILNKLRTNIIYALKQKGLISEQKDGMDMSLCVIDTETNKVDFAGANNPLYVVTTANELKVSEGATVKLNEGLFDEELDYKLFEVKGDKMPIAIYEKMDDFYNNEIQLEKGDCIYMFSDGYADQFGGPKGKKFKYKPFKRLVLGNSQKSMQEQKELLEKSFVDWHEGYDQIDDVVVIGIRI